MFRLFDALSMKIVSKTTQRGNIIRLSNQTDFISKHPAERIPVAITIRHMLRHLIIIDVRGKTSRYRILFIIIVISIFWCNFFPGEAGK